MNEFASTKDSGLLKVNYDDSSSALANALRKKREKLAETKLGTEKEEDSSD